MSKPVQKTFAIDQLVVDFSVNGREKNNYDLPSMKAQIVAAGRIIQPPVVVKEKDRILVLAGNRRTLAGQELFADPTISVQLKEALSRVPVMLYEDLGEKERFEYIFDQGSQKGLSRTEVIKAVKRLYQGFSGDEADIIMLLHHQLANYSGKTRKLNELPVEPKARQAALKKWFHGTVGNYILAAAKMGPYIWDQFVLTHRAEDGLLEDGEKVEMRCSRDRITALSAAKNKDKDNWTPEKGNPEFNKLIEEYKAQDAGELEKEKVKRPTVREMREKADLFKSPIRKAFLIAAGDTGEAVGGLVDDDDNFYRLSKAVDLLVKYMPQLPPTFRTFAQHVIHDSPEKLEEFLKNVK